MTTFGFSAFLKLLSLNARPQRRELRLRLAPREGGYDFHRSLRLRTTRFMIEHEDLDALIAEAASLGNPAERRSLEAGLRQLDAWRRENPGEVIELPSALYTSPEQSFRVSFVPDFGYRLRGQTVAVHVWNTGSVDLVPRMTYAALKLAASSYVTDVVPDDIAVLSLPNNRLFRLSDAPDQTRISAILAAQIDALFEEIRDEMGRPGPAEDSLPGRRRE